MTTPCGLDYSSTNYLLRYVIFIRHAWLAIADDANSDAANRVSEAQNTVNQANSAIGRIPGAVDNGQASVNSYVDSQIGKRALN